MRTKLAQAPAFTIFNLWLLVKSLDQKHSLLFYCLVSVINRPGEVGAVLQTPLLLINSLTNGLWKYLKHSVNPKPLELRT